MPTPPKNNQLDSIEDGVSALRPILEQLVNEMRLHREEMILAREERNDLVNIIKGKRQVPLSVVLVLMISLSSILMLEKLTGQDFKVKGQALGASGEITASKREQDGDKPN